MTGVDAHVITFQSPQCSHELVRASRFILRTAIMRAEPARPNPRGLQPITVTE